MKGTSEKLYPPYRHMELYAWSEAYQKYKFSPYIEQFRYEDRYGSLKQDTVFFKNFCRLDDIRRKCRSWTEFSLKCAVENIEECKARFYLLYMWFSKARWFARDYWSRPGGRLRFLKAKAAVSSKTNAAARYSPAQLEDVENYYSYDDIRRQAFADGHKACGYARFAEREL